MKKILTGLVGAALLTAAGAASATTWDFTQMAAGPYTSPYSFNTTPAGGPVLQTWGFDSTGASAGLWIKHESPGENGLGLQNDVDHEIGPTNAYIALLMPTAQAGNTFTLTIGSLAGGDVAQIYETSSNGTGNRTSLGTLTGGANLQSITVTLTGGDQYLEIVEGKGATADANMLIEKISYVPEPAGLGLLGLSLVGFVALKRRKSA